MNHAITLGGLLSGLCILAGLGCAGIGALTIYASGMSDAADDGTTGTGCMVILAGAVLLIGGIMGLAL
jgi:hypothetical protein